ncbi:MAG: EF-hand domain-containing protein [Candidatus Binatia bacterium]
MTKLTSAAIATILAFGAVPVFACDGAKRADKEAARAAALAQADTNGDGALDANEFAVFHQTMAAQREQRLFAKLDADGNGQVTTEELNNAHWRRGGSPQ